MMKSENVYVYKRMKVRISLAHCTVLLVIYRLKSK